MIKENMVKIWVQAKKNINLYIKKGPVIIFGLLFPFFMTLSWVLGRNLLINQIFIGIVAMTAFFTATAISPVVLPIETREKSLERILSAPLSLNQILLGIMVASALYSFIITSLIALTFIILFPSVLNSFIFVFLLWLGILLMSILGSLLGLLVAGYPTDKTSDVMLIMNLVKFPLLFISGIFIPLELLPFSAVILSFFSPLTFLTDIFRYCVDGHSFFPYQIDLLILILWIIGLFMVNGYIHGKTMPKRFGSKGGPSSMQKMKK